MSEMNEQINSAFETVKDRKATKFKEAAEIRTTKVLKDISNLEKLSNRGSYTYTDDQIRQMFTRLEAALSNAKKAFNPKNTGIEFHFED